jgi:probable rRNA maturation factor
MIVTEVSANREWGDGAHWRGVAQQAATAAVRSSRFAALADSALAVEISVKFASNATVQSLNAAYRGKDAATNVLSFPMVATNLLPSLAAADGGEILLGDVVLAFGICSCEASERRLTLEDHASHLVAHGVLHLLGYDHEQEEGAEAMEKVERDALASIGIADPYQVTEVHS